MINIGGSAMIVGDRLIGMVGIPVLVDDDFGDDVVMVTDPFVISVLLERPLCIGSPPAIVVGSVRGWGSRIAINLAAAYRPDVP